MALFGKRLAKLAQFLATGGTVPETAISTSETDTTLRLAPDGSGGVEWGTGGGGGGGGITSTGSEIADECFSHGSGASSYVGGFGQSVSGTGASLTNGTGEVNHPGVILMNLGTSNGTGRVAFFQIGSNALGIVLGGGEVTFMNIFKLDTLSDGTNTYTARSGLGDSVVGEYVDGVFFRYTNGVNGGRWEAVCRSNNVETGSVLDTGVAADTNYHRFECVINAAGTSAEFFIDGVSVGTITTNIPTGAGREVAAHGLAVVKSLGAANRTFNFDAYRYTFEFTTPR